MGTLASSEAPDEMSLQHFIRVCTAYYDKIDLQRERNTIFRGKL